MPVTYDDLQPMLLATGFVARRVVGSHHQFEHPTTGATFSLPLETRPPRGIATYTAALQGLLDVYGVLGRAEFLAQITPPPQAARRPALSRQTAGR